MVKTSSNKQGHLWNKNLSWFCCSCYSSARYNHIGKVRVWGVCKWPLCHVYGCVQLEKAKFNEKHERWNTMHYNKVPYNYFAARVTINCMKCVSGRKFSVTDWKLLSVCNGMAHLSNTPKMLLSHHKQVNVALAIYNKGFTFEYKPHLHATVAKKERKKLIQRQKKMKKKMEEKAKKNQKKNEKKEPTCTQH